MNLQELDFDNMGQWPLPFKVGAVVLLSAFILFCGYYFDIRSQQQVLSSNQGKETKLKRVFERKQQQAANLAAYQKQMREIEAIFKGLLKKLPQSTEVPGLVEDISLLGLANGLVFKTIKLKPEERKDFYTELPIEISVVGGYHNLGKFVSDVSKLPRIVTLHDFTIQPVDPKLSLEDLRLDVIAKTYRYTAEEETP